MKQKPIKVQKLPQGIKKYNHAKIFLFCLKNGHVSFKVGKDHRLLKDQPMVCLEHGGDCVESHCRTMFGGDANGN